MRGLGDLVDNLVGHLQGVGHVSRRNGRASRHFAIAPDAASMKESVTRTEWLAFWKATES